MNRPKWRFPTDAEITAQIRAARARSRIAAKTEPRARRASYDSKSGLVIIELISGAFFGFPARAHYWLRRATDADLTRSLREATDYDGIQSTQT